MKRPDFSAVGWGRVIAVTIFGTLGCVIAAIYLDSFNFMALSPAERQRAIVFDITVPILIAGPLFFFFMSKLRELAIANRQMSILASTDSLTSVLNRGAFTMLVDAYLSKVEAQQQAGVRGALLVVDADHFKAINDLYGHSRGDEALKLIATSIQAVLQSADLVGRIGGEEFGVFLPGSSQIEARLIAERIRTSIHQADFAPDGTHRPLSVSVGGAVFEAPIGFSELFRIADQRLYEAKQSGRNRIRLGPVRDLGRPVGVALN